MNKKKTKIVCTIGPASWEPSVLSKLIEAGMNVARINGAFADLDELDRVAGLIRSISDNVALMLDIKGLEVRLNKFSETLPVAPGQEIMIGSSDRDPIFPITYPQLHKDIKVGQKILVDKGEVVMHVTNIMDNRIFAKVESGSVIAPGKGLSLPGAQLNNEPLTQRDIEQIKHVNKRHWDFIALSFVRNAGDITKIKDILGDSALKVIAKIEDGQGVDNIDAIIKVADGVMVARGDLGTELPLEKLPIIQKNIIYKCNQAAKPVITATNMLESMTEKVFPTRAEVTDVANAVLEGTDALMTSGETANGKYPVESVEMMSRIAFENEKYVDPEVIESMQLEHKQIAVAICKAAFEMAATVDLSKIFVITQDGGTARILARYMLKTPIYAFVASEINKRQLELTRGVYPFIFPKQYKDRDAAIHAIVTFALDEKLISKKDKILVVGRAAESLTFFPNIFEYINVEEFLTSHPD